MISALTITIGAWIIPILLTAILLIIMFRPASREDTSGYFGGLFLIFRLFWLIPISLIWTIYFATIYWFK